MTLGERGRDGARRRARRMRVPAITATALDTTGAGDLLVAAYIWGDLRGALARGVPALGRDLRGPLDRDPHGRRAAPSARRGCSRKVRSAGLAAPRSSTA